jgi:hypothetical protein
LLLAEESLLVHQGGLLFGLRKVARFGEAVLGLCEAARAHADIRQRFPHACLLRLLDAERLGDVERPAIELGGLDVRELLLRSEACGQ